MDEDRRPPMSDGRLSPATKELIKLAQTDAPGAAARAKIWSGVSSVLGGAAAGGAVASGAGGGGGLSAAKLLALGTLLGGPLTVGLAVTLLYLSTPSTRTPPVRPLAPLRTNGGPGAPSTADVAPVRHEVPVRPPETSLNTGLVPRAAETHARGHAALQGAASKSPGAHTKTAAPPAPSEREDALAREASLVAQAHDALVRGDPNEALRAIGAARRLGPPQLVPEELAVEAQALRLLGRTNEADENEVILKILYPDSALAR
jgi:hypothetical protein